VDATYLRILDTEMKRYVTRPVFIAMGVDLEGYREILGAKIMDREDEGWWTVFFQELKDRGMTGVELVVSDGHRGIKAAVQAMFPGASWQYCHVHFRRNTLKTVGMKHRRQLNSQLNDAMESPALLDELIPVLEKQGFVKAAEMILREEQNLFNHQAFPTARWMRLRTTNSLENVNSVIKRRTRVIGAFPGNNSVYRVVGSLLIGLNNEFATEKRHIDMDRYD
jgi:transposase-like protein